MLRGRPVVGDVGHVALLLVAVVALDGAVVLGLPHLQEGRKERVNEGRNGVVSDIMGEAAETDVEVEVAVQCKWISCKVAKSANLGERRTFTERERHSFPRFCSGFIGQ